MSLLTPFRVTIAPQRAAVAYRHGVRLGVLSAGRHRRTLRTRLVHVDLRERLLPLAAQEVPTADGVQVRVSAVVRYAVTDPVRSVEVSADPVATVYLAVQVALREALGGVAAEDLGRRTALPMAAVVASAQAVALEVGLTVRDVVVKDVVLPADVRAASAALLAARHRGAAVLEEARAETAALRSLANGARVLEAHPALAQQRLVRAMPPGTRLVLTLGGVAGPAAEIPGED